MRATDRLGVVRVLAIIAVLAAVPLSAAVGVARYDAARAGIPADNAGKVALAATVTSDPTTVTSSRSIGYHDYYTATVQWVRDGKQSAARIEVPDTAHPGDQVALWLDRDGRPTTAPLPASSAAWEGIGLTLATLIELWIIIAALVGLTFWLRGAHPRSWALSRAACRVRWLRSGMLGADSADSA
ncbi:hypothetical protein [Nocardia altamirensis]|uniref:hypothetical protein n=1 Tax=Nocardia altamirensis TaxID=472158 RepID=UPI00083FEE70|nr:hypothetical protein [Nocardia altamirensis]